MRPMALFLMLTLAPETAAAQEFCGASADVDALRQLGDAEPLFLHPIGAEAADSEVLVVNYDGDPILDAIMLDSGAEGDDFPWEAQVLEVCWGPHDSLVMLVRGAGESFDRVLTVQLLPEPFYSLIGQSGNRYEGDIAFNGDPHVVD